MGFCGAETGSGHVVNMDGAPDEQNPANGGHNQAPRPMEMVLAGAGGCTAYDVVLDPEAWSPRCEGCSVQADFRARDTDPKVFTKIQHAVHGHAARTCPAAAVERAIAMSHDKYCSATIMLGKTAEITTGFDIVEA